MSSFLMMQMLQRGCDNSKRLTCHLNAVDALINGNVWKRWKIKAFNQIFFINAGQIWYNSRSTHQVSLEFNQTCNGTAKLNSSHAFIFLCMQRCKEDKRTMQNKKLTEVGEKVIFPRNWTKFTSINMYPIYRYKATKCIAVYITLYKAICFTYTAIYSTSTTSGRLSQKRGSGSYQIDNLLFCCLTHTSGLFPLQF